MPQKRLTESEVGLRPAVGSDATRLMQVYDGLMNQSSSRPARTPQPAFPREKSVSVLGAGKVGSAVATLLREAGLSIAAVTTRSPITAEKAAAALGALPTTDNTVAAAAGDIVLITVNDDAIAGVVDEVALGGGFRPGQLVIHLSGALPLAVLAPAADAGALVGCMHPLQSFATAEDATRLIRGSTFGVTAGPGALEVARVARRDPWRSAGRCRRRGQDALSRCGRDRVELSGRLRGSGGAASG